MTESPHPTGKRIKTQYTGVYFRYGKNRMCPDGKPDECYDITYRDAKGKFIFEKVGWRSEGRTVQDAVELREKRVRAIRSGSAEIPRPASSSRKSAGVPKASHVKDALELQEKRVRIIRLESADISRPTGEPTGKRIKTPYVGVYFRYGKRRMCSDGKPDKCFDITYKDAHGKFIFEKVGWRSEGYTVQDAVDLRGERIRKIRHPELFGETPPPLPSGITVDEAWFFFKKNWLPNLKDQYGVERTYEHYIKPQFGTKHILALSELDIENFKQDLLTASGRKGQGLKPGTVLKIISDFKRIVSRAFKWDLVEGKNPLLGISVKNAGAKRDRYLTEKEAEQIFDGLSFVSCALYRISRISLYTGLRLNEILNLRGSDINISQGIIHIKDGKNGNRTAYIPKSFEKELEKLLPDNRTEFLFKNSEGKRVSRNVMTNAFSKFIKETGLNATAAGSEQKIVFHTFRHTFCSWLAIAGVSLYKIAKLAGHKTISMTQRYAKLSPDTQREALKHLPIK